MESDCSPIIRESTATDLSLPKRNSQISESDNLSPFAKEILNNKFCIVEFDYYRGNDGNIVVKELAIVFLPELRRQHWVFLPPVDEEGKPLELDSNVKFQNEQKRKMTYMAYGYYDGDVPQENLPSMLNELLSLNGNIVVFVNGNLKSKFIASQIQRPVYNFQKLVENVSFNRDLNGDESYYDYNYKYASVCLKHSETNRNNCPKACCTYFYSMIKKYKVSIIKGLAKIQLVTN